MKKVLHSILETVRVMAVLGVLGLVFFAGYGFHALTAEKSVAMQAPIERIAPAPASAPTEFRNMKGLPIELLQPYVQEVNGHAKVLYLPDTKPRVVKTKSKGGR